MDALAALYCNYFFLCPSSLLDCEQLNGKDHILNLCIVKFGNGVWPIHGA